MSDDVKELLKLAEAYHRVNVEAGYYHGSKHDEKTCETCALFERIKAGEK